MPPPPLRAVTRSLSAIALNQIIQIVGSAMFVLLVPRTLGATLFGQLAVAFAFSTILHTLGELGYQEIFSRYVPEVQAQAGAAGVRALAQQLLGLRLWLGLALGLLAFACAPLAASWFTLDQRLLIGLAVSARVWAMGDFALLLGLGATAQWVRETSWRQLTLTGLILLFNQAPTFTLSLLALTLHEVVFWGLGRWWVRRLLVSSDWGEVSSKQPALSKAEGLAVNSKQLAVSSEQSPISNLQSLITNYQSPVQRIGPVSNLQSLLRFGLLFALANFALALLFRLGPLLVEKLGGLSAQTGFFDLASSAWLLIYVALGQVALALVPILTTLHLAGQQAEINLWLGRLVRYATVVAALALGGIWAIAPTALPLAFEPAFGPAQSAFMRVALGLLPLPLAWACVARTTVDKQPTRKLVATLVGLGVFLGLAWWLHGRTAAGSAAEIALAFSGSIAGYTVGFGRTAWALWRHTGKSWLLATLASVIFVPLLIWPIPSLPFALIAWAACALGYVFLLFLFRIIQTSELKLMYEAKEKAKE